MKFLSHTFLLAGYIVRDSEAQGGSQPVHRDPGQGGGGRGREPLSGEEADPDEGGRKPAGNFALFGNFADLEKITNVFAPSLPRSCNRSVDDA